jgi:hypothetical protein
MILGMQLLGILFGIVMIYFTFLYYKRHNYDKLAFIFWLVTWLGVITIFGLPKLIYGVMDFLAIQRTADFFTATAIIFLTTLIFYLYSSVKKTESRVERLVRTLALETAEQEKKQLKPQNKRK